MATKVVVPSLGESVKTAKLIKWHKTDGQSIKLEEPVCELETDKANVDIPAPAGGAMKLLKKEGDTVEVGEVIAEIDESAVGAAPAKSAAAPAKPASAASAGSPAPKSAAASTGGQSSAGQTSAGQTSAAQSAGGQSSGGSFASPQASTATISLEDFSPAVRRLIEENHLDPAAIPATGPSGRLTKEDVEGYLSKNGHGSDEMPAAVQPAKASTAPTIEKKKDVATTSSAPATSGPPSSSQAAISYDKAGIHRAPMSAIRVRIAETLVNAQRTAAILTTFNEVDLTEIINLRTKYKERFQEVHGIGLGFMSFFAKATVLALKEFPRVNAFIDGKDVVYHQFVNLGIAVSTERGLAVPVMRNAEKMSFARIEAEIKRLANATRDGKLSLEELSGGTFTITNGGVFGSLLSTPILLPPQSGILGMHTIQKRPMVVNDKIEIRSMMYLALSYDHRLVDGKESVSFLVRLKQYLEDPARLMLEI